MQGTVLRPPALRCSDLVDHARGCGRHGRRGRDCHFGSPSIGTLNKGRGGVSSCDWLARRDTAEHDTRTLGTNECERVQTSANECKRVQTLSKSAPHAMPLVAQIPLFPGGLSQASRGGHGTTCVAAVRLKSMQAFQPPRLRPKGGSKQSHARSTSPSESTRRHTPPHTATHRHRFPQFEHTAPLPLVRAHTATCPAHRVISLSKSTPRHFHLTTHMPSLWLRHPQPPGGRRRAEADTLRPGGIYMLNSGYGGVRSRKEMPNPVQSTCMPSLWLRRLSGGGGTARGTYTSI